MDDSQREKTAIFRYGVISQLVSRPLAPGEKERLLAEIASERWTIPGTTRTTIGRSTARDWVALYEVHGFDGLKPVPRRDAGGSRTIPESAQETLLKLRAERPKAAVSSLIRAAQLSGAVDVDLRLPPSTVYRFLKAHRAELAPGITSTQPDAVAFTYPHTGDLWMADLMHGPRLLIPGRRGGTKSYLYALLDDATRMVPYAAFHTAENAACFQHVLKQALLRRGIPRRLYCDNGAAFRTHHLQLVCATLNIALIHTRPYKPRGRGKLERFFRRVRSAFLAHLNPEMLCDLDQLNRLFWAWLEAEYHQTPHAGIDGQTPLDRFLEQQDFIRPAPDDLEPLMRMKVKRRVGRDRTVRLHGQRFEAPDGYAGETVEVLYDPYDPIQPVHFRRPGDPREIALRRLDLHDNATRPRPPREEPNKPAEPSTGISYLDLIAKNFYRDKEDET
jgi:transposase InsO family protein